MLLNRHFWALKEDSTYILLSAPSPKCFVLGVFPYFWDLCSLERLLFLKSFPTLVVAQHLVALRADTFLAQAKYQKVHILPGNIIILQNVVHFIVLVLRESQCVPVVAPGD